MVRRRATSAATEVTSPPANAATAELDAVSSEIDVSQSKIVSKIQASKTNGTAAKSLVALKVELEQAAQRETLMQRQMRELESQLVMERDNIGTLQTQLDACQTLADKLAQSEETVRQLAQANTKLSQALEDLQNSVPKPAAKTAPRALPAKVEPPAPVLDAHDALMLHQRQRLAHPIFPDKKLPGQMLDQDLGWFD
jgi:DNA repair exonuclease SbcCD ATPase subunit